MIDIFLSRPTWVSPDHKSGLDNFLGLLATMELNPRTLGTTDYPSKCPLDEVIELMDRCQGAIILGYPQITATQGRVKSTEISEPLLLPTEWNHIEAGLAYARDLPLLVVRHTGVVRGIFDRGAISNFLHEADFGNPAWPLAKEISGALTKWKADVLQEKAKGRTQGDHASPLRPSLTDEHVQLLQLFSKPEQYKLQAGAIAQMMKISTTKAEYLLDQLLEDDFVGRLMQAGGPTRYYLEPAGRAALAERGLL